MKIGAPLHMLWSFSRSSMRLDTRNYDESKVLAAANLLC